LLLFIPIDLILGRIAIHSIVGVGSGCLAGGRAQG